jgi:hypothetical protein
LLVLSSHHKAKPIWKSTTEKRARQEQIRHSHSAHPFHAKG